MSNDDASDAVDLELILAALVDNAPVAIALFDHQMRYMLANRQWIQEFGLQQVNPLVGRSQYEIFPGLHPEWRQVYDRALQGHVVRSEHDVLAGPEGQRLIYRWEVRPWRRRKDASVGGLMVTCERYAVTPPAPQAAEPDGDDLESGGDLPPAAAAAAMPEFFECTLPMAVVDGHGVIHHINLAAASLSLARGVQEGVSHFWEACCDGPGQADLRQQLLGAISRLAGEEGPASVMIDSPGRPPVSDDASCPARWMLSPVKGGGKLDCYLAIGLSLPPAPQQAVPPSPATSASLSALAGAVAAVSSPAAGNGEGAAALEIRRLQDDLARARQELRTLHDAEQTFSKREGRVRHIMDTLPCAVLVLDENGTPVYQNRQVTQLLGRPITTDENVESWLAAACPDAEHRESVVSTWRESVWRRQLTRVVSLVTADGLLKELEFKPLAMPGGGLLVSIQDLTEFCRHEEQLRAMEARFRVLLAENPLAILLMDKTGAIYEANHQAEKLLGRSKAELRRYPLDSWLEPESATERRDFMRSMREARETNGSLPVRVRQTSGGCIDAVLHIAEVADMMGDPHCTIHLFQTQPPTPPHAATRAGIKPVTPSPQGLLPSLLPSQPANRLPVQVTLLKTNVNGRISLWSPAAEKLLGCTAEEAMTKPLHQFFRPSDPSGFYAELSRHATGFSGPFELRYYPRSGPPSTAAFTVSNCGGRAMDYELRMAEAPAPAQIRADAAASLMQLSPHLSDAQRWPVADLEREKLLLSETHHRIKNHLQIISSLLNLELSAVNEHNARSALRSSQNRVRSIASLHQHLYLVALGNHETFKDYALGLVNELRACYEVSEQRVRVRLDLQEGPIQQEWLMPLALTLNETLSNALEHAFPSGRSGNILVQLAFGPHSGEFVVRDDGIGLPQGFKPEHSEGLGLKILAVFADQMRGQLFVSRNDAEGTEIRLRFPIAHADI